MPEKVLPRYPVYIPSKGRADNGLTAPMFLRDGVPFYLVVEPQEEEAYASRFGTEHLLVLPFSNLGQGSIPARNWIMQHSIEVLHAERHWQFDDNVGGVYRWYKGKRIPARSGIALRVLEDFTDRYENVALSGFQYDKFMVGKGEPPFTVNHHVYSATLVNNAIPYRWRGRYNEDTDICLQALSGGWCTLLLSVFTVVKIATMTMKGGNMVELYKGDGRLKMAKALERMWPGVVTTSRRFQRPQHRIYDDWRRFDTPLRLKPGVDLDALREAGPNDYGMELHVAPGRTPKSAFTKGLIDAS